MDLAEHFNNGAVSLLSSDRSSDRADGEVLLNHAASSIQCDAGTQCSALEVEPTAEPAVPNHGLRLYPHFFRFTASQSNLQAKNSVCSHPCSGKLLFDVGFRPMGRECGGEGKLIALAVCYYNQALVHQLRYFLKEGSDHELSKAARLYQITHDLLLGNCHWKPDARNPRAPASVVFLATCTNMACLSFELSDVKGVALWSDKLGQWLPFFKWYAKHDSGEASKTCPERQLFRLAHLLPALDRPTTAGAA
mmetsp:Transcript_26326/g.72676  ORF Transcript_26326/g.72676 Transcript_26326/m.72676 type:complete len:250 (+) Transcript_26326:141-890(+)